MQDANAAANLAMTLVPRDRAQRSSPARAIEMARQGLIERIGAARYSRSTWRGGRLYVVAVVIALFGWSVLVIIVFAENASRDHSSDGLQPMLVGVAVAVAASGLLAIWHRRDIGSTIPTAVPILAVIALFFRRFASMLLKFCRNH